MYIWKGDKLKETDLMVKDVRHADDCVFKISTNGFLIGDGNKGCCNKGALVDICPSADLADVICHGTTSSAVDVL